MITIYLEANVEKIAPTKPFPSLAHLPLYHQVRTLEALRQYDVVMNTYNTGTGKTIASLLYLFDLHAANQADQTRQRNVLFIAPTNALIGQHTDDIEQFVEQNNLDFKVMAVTAAEISALQSDLRRGEILTRLIRNYLTFTPTESRRKPLILVTNPDIFYYALFFRYGAHDQRNLFSEFVSRFDYMVIDEFHYYDYKQLANFLFAFALFDQLGYFGEQRQRKICLLSATPAEKVTVYMARLFEASRWTTVAPENEPAESAEYETIPTLTPLTLTLAEGLLHEWIDEAPPWLLDNNQDGVLISSSLAEINTAYYKLRQRLPQKTIGRITGPEPAAERLQATARRLILATPTVDIGYNFRKLDKPRQNIDFVVLDARFEDELLQRVGRAGRVLDKEETTIPSQGVALVSQEVLQVLRDYDGQTLSRAAFKGVLQRCALLPPKHTLDEYIQSYAIMENFWPIYQYSHLIPPRLQTEMDALLRRLKAVFLPRSIQTKGHLKAFFRGLRTRKEWLKANAAGFSAEATIDEDTANLLYNWLHWLKIPENDVPEFMTNTFEANAFYAFVESQVKITEALFAFRDSFQGPSAVVYDPDLLLSSQTVNRHDLFHLLRTYKLSPLFTPAQFKERCAPTDLKADFYVALKALREVRWQLILSYQSGWLQPQFEKWWCCAPVALKGIRLYVREAGGDIINMALEEKMSQAVADQAIPLLIIPPDSVGVMRNRLRGSHLWSYPLQVQFPDGTEENNYQVLLGKGAFMGHALLKGHFWFKDRMKPEAIII